MKDLITSIASILILMMFVMQFAANQVSFTKIMGAEAAVEELSLLAENQGQLKGEDIAALKDKLSNLLGCGPQEIEVSLSEPGSDLEVTVPVYGVVGPAKIIGISPSENVRRHKITRYIGLPEEEGES